MFNDLSAFKVIYTSCNVASSLVFDGAVKDKRSVSTREMYLTDEPFTKFCNIQKCVKSLVMAHPAKLLACIKYSLRRLSYSILLPSKNSRLWCDGRVKGLGKAKRKLKKWQSFYKY